MKVSITRAQRRRLHTYLGKWYEFTDRRLTLPDFRVMSYDPSSLLVRVHFDGQRDPTSADLRLFVRAIERGAIVESTNKH